VQSFLLFWALLSLDRLRRGFFPAGFFKRSDRALCRDFFFPHALPYSPHREREGCLGACWCIPPFFPINLGAMSGLPFFLDHFDDNQKRTSVSLFWPQTLLGDKSPPKRSRQLLFFCPFELGRPNILLLCYRPPWKRARVFWHSYDSGPHHFGGQIVPPNVPSPVASLSQIFSSLSFPFFEMCSQRGFWFLFFSASFSLYDAEVPKNSGLVLKEIGPSCIVLRFLFFIFFFFWLLAPPPPHISPFPPDRAQVFLLKMTWSFFCSCFLLSLYYRLALSTCVDAC